MPGNEQKIFILLIGLVLVRGLIYISIIPPWLAPDEATHFEAIRLIGQEAIWPTEEVYQTTPMHPQMHASFEKFRIWQISGLPSPYGSLTPGDPSGDPYLYYYPAHNSGSVIIAGQYPLIYHLLLAPVSALLKSLDIEQQLYLLRLSSLFFTALVVAIAWFFARTIFPESITYAVGLASFLVFLPMHLHINTALNTDVLSTLLVSFYFLTLAKLLCQQFSLAWLAMAVTVFGLAILAKPTALFIIPTTAAAAEIYLARRLRWNPRLVSLTLVAMVVFTLIGSITIFQVSEGGRGLATLSFSTAAVELNADYFNRPAIAVYLYTIKWGFLSFWGLFGWANIAIPGIWSWILWRFCLVIGVGGMIFFVRCVVNLRGTCRELKDRQRDILVVLLLSLLFALIGIYTPIIVTQSRQWGPPSRYLFPALLPLALFFFLSFQQLVPVRFSRYILSIWLTLLIGFDSLVIFDVLIPFIYG